MSRVTLCPVLFLFLFVAALSLTADHGLGVITAVAQTRNNDERVWHRLISEAHALGLPTQFLRRITPGFVTIEFEDLRSFAAEYHPDGHRMVLNRSLSLNAAGGILKPLSRLTHQELATLYHELFHAYMDVIRAPSTEVVPESKRLHTFAREQQRCRYHRVLINPLRQRKSFMEERFLTEAEAWEALNETWAVFVEWAIWTRLQLDERRRAEEPRGTFAVEEWLRLLKEADKDVRLVGFYEPTDPDERAVTPKRYLAPPYRVTPTEVAILLEVVFEESPQSARRAADALTSPGTATWDLATCKAEGP